VVPEVTGLLIPPGYPEAISEAVLKLLRDPARRWCMGQAARAWVCAHFADEHVLKLATDFYKSLLKPASAGHAEIASSTPLQERVTTWLVAREADQSIKSQRFEPLSPVSENTRIAPDEAKRKPE
jgi:hypothetical protein